MITVLVWLTGLFFKYKNFHIKKIIPPWTDILPIFIIIPKCHIFPEVKPLFKFRNTGFRYVVIAYLLTLSKFTALSATTLSHSPNQHSKASQPPSWHTCLRVRWKHLQQASSLAKNGVRLQISTSLICLKDLHEANFLLQV